MREIKTIVCLANSRNLSGRCIAGREIMDKKVRGWIRPVSDRPGEEVSEYERQYEDGSDPRVLDIINVPLLAARPNHHQQENWLLDPASYWVKQGQAPWERLFKLIDPVDTLWENGSNTISGKNDRMSPEQVSQLNSSLCFIHVDSLTLSVFSPGKGYGDPKRKVQAHFTHNDVSYSIWVTDPSYERKYLKMSDGDYTLGECYLTISINGEPYQGQYYKFVAAIIARVEGQESS